MKAKDAARREIIARQRYEQAQMIAMAQKEAEMRSNAAVATWLGFLQAQYQKSSYNFNKLLYN
jgi:hypothetical protein